MELMNCSRGEHNNVSSAQQLCVQLVSPISQRGLRRKLIILSVFFHYVSVHSLFQKRRYFSTIKNSTNKQQLWQLVIFLSVNSKWHTGDLEPVSVPGIYFIGWESCTLLNQQLSYILVAGTVNESIPVKCYQGIKLNAYLLGLCICKSVWKYNEKKIGRFLLKKEVTFKI